MRASWAHPADRSRRGVLLRYSGRRLSRGTPPAPKSGHHPPVCHGPGEAACRTRDFT
ncbi:hypothetical protein KCP73_01500 [Salmonella enterica subsp. enterica]|nr:hypothetical protein KCP73_01500 [Salmonella enterica subsp. enterica]